MQDKTGVFITVLEPYQRECRIKEVNILPRSSGNSDDTSFGVEIIMKSCKHYFFGSLNHKVDNTFIMNGSEVIVNAEAAFFEEVDGKISRGFVSSGRGLHKGGEFLISSLNKGVDFIIKRQVRFSHQAELSVMNGGSKIEIMCFGSSIQSKDKTIKL